MADGGVGGSDGGGDGIRGGWVVVGGGGVVVVVRVEKRKRRVEGWLPPYPTFLALEGGTPDPRCVVEQPCS